MDTRLIEPDEQWKADLRRRIEHDFRHMVEDAQKVRDTILDSRPSESDRERAHREFEDAMNAIRKIAQEEFNRELRTEILERKWALDVVRSNSPDVARQQQWILHNIRKADDDRPSFVNPDSPKNAEGVLSARPQEQIDSERASNESLEGGYGSAIPEDEGTGSDQSMESEEGEGDVQPRQSRPNASLTQPYSSSPDRHWSRVARPSEPSGISRTFAHANGQTYSPSPVQVPRRGSAGPHIPHNGMERPRTQARDRIASNIGPRDRQMSASASPHDRHSPPNFPTMAPRATPGARPPPLDDAVRLTFARSGSRTLFSIQRSPEDTRQGVAIPRGPTAAEDGPPGASWASPHSHHSYGDYNIHRWHNSKGDPRMPPVDGGISDASDDVPGQLDDQQSVRSVRSMELEQMTLYSEAEARRKEEEATRKEEEASRKEEEVRRLEEKARLSLEEAERLQAGVRQLEASAKMREAVAQKKEAEAKHKEAEAQKREAEAQKREAEARRKEEAARHREHEARRKEEQSRWKEEEAQRKEEEARKREDEVRRKEDDARKQEDDARKRAEDAREREMLARQKEEDARRSEEEARKKEEEVRRKDDEARRKKEAKRIEQDNERKKREIEQREAELKIREAELIRKEQAARLAQEELEARRPADETSRLGSEATSPVDAEEVTPDTEDAAKADAPNCFPDSARQARAAECTATEREEERILEDKRLEEERPQRGREQQIRLDEESSRQGRAHINREAVLEQERLHRDAQEKEANRIREEQMRAAEEARYGQLEEQRRKQQQHQQDEIARQRAKEEQQKEFERRAAQYRQRTVERERQNSMGASFEARNEHRSGSTMTGSAGDRSGVSSAFSPSAGPTWSNRPFSTNTSHTRNSSFPSSSVPLSSTPRPRSARPGTPGTPPFAFTLDEAEWARRADERARQQQEQFRREQERIESETQAKSAKVLSRDELIRLYENNENKWRLLKEVLLKEAEVRHKEEEVIRKEGGTRGEEGVRHLEERAQPSFETAQRFQSGVREVEAKAKKSEAEVQSVEEQLREKERLLKIREVEIQKALQTVNERRDAVNIQEDSLRQKSTALRDREENLYRREATLMQSMAIERQRNGAYQDSELDSLATESTIRNTSKLTNVALSPKSYARMKEDSEYFSNEG